MNRIIHLMKMKNLMTILAATVCGVALHGAGRDMDRGGRGEWPFIVIRHSV